MAIRKELKELMHAAFKQGWEITMTKSTHLRWESPEGNVVFTSYSPSDWRALIKIKRDLRSNGFIEVTTKGKHVKNQSADKEAERNNHSR